VSSDLDNYVVQELTPNSRCPLDVYSQARITAKREAQEPSMQMVLPQEGLASEVKLQSNGRMSS